MQLQLLYFGALSETLGCRSETLDTALHLTTIAELASALTERGEAWAQLAAKLSQGHIKTARNQELAQPNTPIQEGDEIAFFPPVTGG